MTQLVSVDRPAAGIVRLTLGNGAENRLSAALRRALDTELAAALGRADTRAVLIGAGGRGFSAGLDPEEVGGPDAAAALGAICGRLDAAAVPVVAALHGPVVSGGCELAFAAHFRVAALNMRLGLPDIAVGLPPSAGTTQRLPRLAAPEMALDLLLSGRPFDALQAERAGLVDLVVDADLDRAALRFTRMLIEEGIGPRPAFGRPLPAYGPLHAEIAARRAALAPTSPVAAPARILDCLEAAAILPRDSALAFEAAAFEDCADSPATRALRHLTGAERQLRDRGRASASAGREAQTVGIWGATPRAADLAARILATGAAVRIAAMDETGLSATIGAVDAALGTAEAAGRLSASARTRCWTRLSGGLGPPGLGGADMIVEAGAEDWSARQTILRMLGTALRPGGVLVATGVLTTPASLAAACRQPRRALWLNLPGLHPAGEIAELIGTRETASDALAMALTLVRKIGRIVLPARDGSPALSVLLALIEAAEALVEAGASPYAVDAAMERWGLAAGPYRLADRLGLPTLLALRARQPGGDDPARRPILVLGQLVADGRTGLRGGRGYYLYPDASGRGQRDPAVEALVVGSREILGKAPARVSLETMRDQGAAAMVQAGAGLWRQGAVDDPALIDLAAVHGLGVARWRGGPLCAADETGLLAIRRTLLTMSERADDAALWTPDPLIGELIKNGRRFLDLAAPEPATEAALSSA